MCCYRQICMLREIHYFTPRLLPPGRRPQNTPNVPYLSRPINLNYIMFSSMTNRSYFYSRQLGTMISDLATRSNIRSWRQYSDEFQQCGIKMVLMRTHWLYAGPSGLLVLVIRRTMQINSRPREIIIYFW